mgnify:CR=1 FL=1
MPLAQEPELGRFRVRTRALRADREGRLYINDTLVPRRNIGAHEGDTLYIETLPSSDGGVRPEASKHQMPT